MIPMSALAIDFTQPFEDAFGKLLGFVPNLLGGLVILVIGYFVAKMLGKLVGKLLGKVGFDQWMERAGVSGILQRSGTGLTASAMLGKVRRSDWVSAAGVRRAGGTGCAVPGPSGFIAGRFERQLVHRRRRLERHAGPAAPAAQLIPRAGRGHLRHEPGGRDRIGSRPSHPYPTTPPAPAPRGRRRA
jgi:hypothetical protein